jgi:hypothetical protein
MLLMYTIAVDTRQGAGPVLLLTVTLHTAAVSIGTLPGVDHLNWLEACHASTHMPYA